MKPIFEALEEYGWDLRGEGSQQIQCPRATHHKDEDRNPSAKVFDDSGMVHCFGCGFRVNVVGLIEHMESVSTEEAKVLANKRYGWEIDSVDDKVVLALFLEYEASLRRLLAGKKMPNEMKVKYYNKLDVVRALLHDSKQDEVERSLRSCVKLIKETLDSVSSAGPQ